MTTKGFVFIPLRIILPILMPFSVHTVNLRLRQATSDGPHAVVRCLRFVLPPLHKPNASRVAESNTNPSPPTLASPSAIRPAWSPASLNPGPRQRKTRGRGERGVSEGGDSGAHQASSGSRGRRERGASTEATAGGNRPGAFMNKWHSDIMDRYTRIYSYSKITSPILHTLI